MALRTTCFPRGEETHPVWWQGTVWSGLVWGSPRCSSPPWKHMPCVCSPSPSCAPALTRGHGGQEGELEHTSTAALSRGHEVAAATARSLAISCCRDTQTRHPQQPLVREGWPWDSLLHPAGHSSCQEETALSGCLSKRRWGSLAGEGATHPPSPATGGPLAGPGGAGDADSPLGTAPHGAGSTLRS